MASRFVSIEDDGQTVTLTADLGIADAKTDEGMKQIDIRRIPNVCIVTESRQDLKIGPVDVQQAGTHLYTTFSARAAKPGRIAPAVYKGPQLAEALLKVLEPGTEWKRYRFIPRVQQPANELTLRIQTDRTVEIREFGALCKIPT
jgi:hypothetical protein